MVVQDAMLQQCIACLPEVTSITDMATGQEIYTPYYDPNVYGLLLTGGLRAGLNEAPQDNTDGSTGIIFTITVFANRSQASGLHVHYDILLGSMIPILHQAPGFESASIQWSHQSITSPPDPTPVLTGAAAAAIGGALGGLLLIALGVLYITHTRRSKAAGGGGMGVSLSNLSKAAVAPLPGVSAPQAV